jgi:hypothetical protein
MRKLMLSMFVAVALVTLASATASAQTYGDAGCGLGSMVFGNKPGIIQIFAATTNGIGGQTFAITTGTSNCGGSSASISATKAFIETNREALAKDISRGQGETVANLATLSGCRDAALLGGSLQRNFKTIFPSAGIPDVQVSDSVVRVMKGDPTLACSKI